MKVDLLNRHMVDSDLGVVNAARCSFDKASRWLYEISDTGENVATLEDPFGEYKKVRVLSEQDSKLIIYLAKHNHWTPFAHAQETFQLNMPFGDEHEFLYNANLSGFEWSKATETFTVRGSLYAWLTNYQYLPKIIHDPILFYINKKYPVSTFTILKPDDVKPLAWLENSHVQHISNPTCDENIVYTFRIHCPLFVKRQLETHRRNFVLTDIEDFSQNEVSRRYVDSTPQFYHPDKWRLQSTDKKQGSSEEEISAWFNKRCNAEYEHVLNAASHYYDMFNKNKIAHEMSRIMLPVSSYTTFWWTGSLKSWRRFFDLRLGEHVQGETKVIAQMVYYAIATDILMKNVRDNEKK